MSNTTKASILCVILLVAAGIRVHSFHGYWGADDGEYALLADAMSHGNFAPFVQENYVRHFNAPAHLPFRMGVIAPVAVLFKVFGVGERVMIAYPLAVSILGVLVAFAAGNLFFGATAGLIAAGLWAFVPADVEYATSLLPDGIASFYGCLAVLAVLYLRNAGIKSPARAFAGGMVAGLLFGVSWLSKESVFYLVPFCGVLLVLDAKAGFKRALPLWAGIAAGSLGILLTEMTVYGITTGDFMLRMHENERSFVQTRSYLFYEGSRFGWPVGGSHLKALVNRLFLEGPSRIFLNDQFLFLPLFGLVTAARALYWKDRSFLIPCAWLITLVLMYNFASCSFSSYTPLVLLNRYLDPLILPSVVLTAGLIVSLLQPDSARSGVESQERFFWGSIAVTALVLVGGYVTFREVRDLARVKPMYETRQLADVVGPGDRVYTDPLSRKALAFFWKYPPSTGLQDFEGLGPDAVDHNSFVLVDKNRLNWLDVNVNMWLTKDYGYHAPQFAQASPSSWKVKWQNDYATLYRVD